MHGLRYMVEHEIEYGGARIQISLCGTMPPFYEIRIRICSNRSNRSSLKVPGIIAWKNIVVANADIQPSIRYLQTAAS